jgi:hypothetical protein
LAGHRGGDLPKFYFSFEAILAKIGDPARGLGVQTKVVGIARSRPSLATTSVNPSEDMFATTTKTKVAKGLWPRRGPSSRRGDPLPLVGQQVEAIAKAPKSAGFRSAIGGLRELISDTRRRTSP